MQATIIFHHIGGYHAARIKAAHEQLKKRGASLCALEVVSSSEEHPWNYDASTVPFKKISLFGSTDEVTVGSLKKRLVSVLETNKPSVLAIPGWGSSEARTALAWARKNAVPAILMSESKADDAPRFFFKELVKSHFFVRRFDCGLVGGKAHADYLRALGMRGDRIYEGYDAVDNDYFARAADSFRDEKGAEKSSATPVPNAPYFLVVTRFIPRKNLERLVQAYAEYRTQLSHEKPWSLVICGGGAYEERLRRLIADKGLQEAVLLPGFISYDELPRWYAFAGALVHPAIQEQWGLVLNEAAASALPILASDTVGAAATLVEDGKNGYLFPPLDVQAIASVLWKMHRMPTEQRVRMGYASREIASCWGPGKFAEGFASAFSACQVIGRGRRGT